MSRYNGKSLPIVEGIKAVFGEYGNPLGVRQVYYQLAAKLRLVSLSKKGYAQAQRLMLKMRRNGDLPWHWFADRARQKAHVSQWDGLRDFAQAIGNQYRKDLWQAQPVHCEIWLEKDALSAFVRRISDRYGVPLYPMRGYSSATFIYEGAEALKQIDKPKYIYYLGDHDASGENIEQTLRRELDYFGVNDVTFERIAIKLDDIDAYGLQSLPVKRSDTRSAKYLAKHGDRTIEIDALPPNVLHDRIEEAITRHIDEDEWYRLRAVERVELQTIRNLAEQMGGQAA